MAKLSTRRLAATDEEPAAWLALLHGIYGAGRNWASVARSIVTARPDWGAVLVDLRQHGESQGFEAPHTLETTAADLDGITPGGSTGGHAAGAAAGTDGREAGVRAILGHSFGGKIALLRGRDDPMVEQLWIVDSTPEAREPEGSAWGMLEVLRRLPAEFEDRDAAVAALEAQGVARPIGLWMSTNLDWRGESYRWRIDLDDMEALLRDFFRTDLWDVVEAPREGLEIHFIRAKDSPVLDLHVAERIRAAGRATGQVFVHDVAGGHWLNADNPEAVVELVTDRLPAVEPAR